MIVRVLFCSASEFLSRWKIRWLQLLAFMFCNNIWAKLEIRSFIWNRNTKISREATESELSKLMMVRVAFCSALVFFSDWKIRWFQLLAIKFCNNIWAKLEIRWNRNTKISREATESELSKLMMVRVAFCSALVFCYLVNKSLKISLECAPPVINFQREERTET